MNLTEYCTGIADAIREKEGSTGKIPAPDHAARIKAITTGVDTSADTVVADALTEGYTAHDAAGNIVNGANPYDKTATDTTINAQADLIAQIQTALEGKAAGGGLETATITFGYDYAVAYTNGNGEVVVSQVANGDKITVAKNTVIWVIPYTGDITCTTGGVVDGSTNAIYDYEFYGLFYATADGTIYDD